MIMKGKRFLTAVLSKAALPKSGLFKAALLLSGLPRAALLLSALLTASLSLSACSGGNGSRETAAYIGIEAAKEAALSSAGISSSLAEVSTAGLDEKDGISFYQIRFTADGVNYEYAVDALTGIVIQEGREDEDSSDKFMADETGSAVQDGGSPSQEENLLDQTETPSGQMAGASVQTADSSNQAADSSTQPVTSPALSGGFDAPVDAGKAEDIALAHAGVSRETVSKLETKRDSDDGLILYEVKFHSADGGKHEYEIDAATGKILSFDSKLSGHGSGDSCGENGSHSLIGEKAAGQKVLARVPGAAEEAVTLSLREDDGRMEYEGKLVFDGMEYEFKIDAYSGALIEWEAEPCD